MDRRTVLKSVAAVSATSTVGLAGCNGFLGGGCDTPGDDFEDSLPDSDDYEERETETGDGDDIDVELERFAGAIYTGPDNDRYAFIVIEYSDADDAEGGGDYAEGVASGDFGYIVAGKYAYFAGGPGEDEITEFMEASPTLGDCVSNNIEFIEAEEPAVDSPTASFEFDYSTDETLEITHENGDIIKAKNLYIRGDFDGDASNGNWCSFENCSASASEDDDDAVQSGDSTTIPNVGPAYDLNVVWEDGENSATLTSDTGPDA